MLNPSIVGTRIIGRSTPDITRELVAAPFGFAPFLEREGRVGNHAVEPSNTATLQDLWVAQGVALHDIEVGGTVQEKVHLGNSGVGDILLLSEDIAAT